MLAYQRIPEVVQKPEPFMRHAGRSQIRIPPELQNGDFGGVHVRPDFESRTGAPAALDRLAKMMCVDPPPKRELNSPEAVADLVDAFYAKVVADAVLGPIFKNIDLQQHEPKVRAYWRKVLLGERGGNRRNMIAQHRELHARHPLRHRHFQRWLALFLETVDERLGGNTATRAKRLASTVAIRLETLLPQVSHQGEGHARE